MKINRRYISLIVFLTLLNIASTQEAKKCSIYTFQCKNGDCIASSLLCDGWPNCKDQSDETEAECSKPGRICPEYAFRCNYGACINGDLTCDGTRDCLDNSDETLPKCTQISTNITTSVQCPENQVKCDNGQCIDSNAQCDGTVDCSDQSDETFLKCGSFNCPQLVFRCNYGACVNGDAKCDGIRHCADGSDEDPKLCEGTTKPSVSTTENIIPINTPTPYPWMQASCLIPVQPKYGNYKLHKSECQSNQRCDTPQDGLLRPGTRLTYSCDPGYKIQGSREVFCDLRGSWSTVPECVEIKCKPLSSASTEATCTYKNLWTSCEIPVKPGTRAQVSCRNSYRQDTTFLSIQRVDVECNDSGEWQPQPVRCVPECGITNTKYVPLIVNGTAPNIAEFPWHASLYQVKNPGGPKEFSCGATIIKDNLLITAAHCVYDEQHKKVYNPERYHIVTGNVFRDYDGQHNPHTVKKATVKKIYINCGYLGLEGNYASDIALLEITEPFIFSSLLLPACLDITKFNEQFVLESGSVGRVAGFGRTGMGELSAILQSISLPYVPHNQCKSVSGVAHSVKFITQDKFCAGYTNGTAVCDGDSGGGLVFETGHLWYIRGIVSVGLGETLIGGSSGCNSYSYSLYTRISNHISWIQDVIEHLETSKPLNECHRVAL